MEVWHKIGIFLVGFIGLIWYLYGSAKQGIEEIKREQSPEKTQKVRTPQEKLIFSLIFLTVCILAMFIIPIILQKIITYLVPDSHKFSAALLKTFIMLLYYSGERYFDNGLYFLQQPGWYILEWFFILFPYIILFTIWTVRMIFRTIRVKP